MIYCSSVHTFIKKALPVLFFFWFITGYSQVDSTIVLSFDFDEHEIKETDHKVIPRSLGVFLTKDRFGNEKSAVYFQGHSTSYLNLGTSPLLKPTSGTISLWVNLERKVYAGTGYEANPIIVTKNSPNDDFYDAYNFFYDFKSNRFMAWSSKDSTQQAGVNSIDEVVFGKWYHTLFTYDSTHIAFYIDGELQLRAHKNFNTVFNLFDSVIIGHSANKKNQRYMRGAVDDIHIYHRVLSAQEIQELYHAPNPNRVKQFFYDSIKYVLIILFFLVVIIVIIYRNRRKLKQQKEQLELANKISELELRVVKAQMNPHFISNCLAAIQELIYKNDIERAGQYIAKFSYFLRQVLNYSDKNYITIAEEVDMIELNIELEQLRFKKEFNFELKIDEAIDPQYVLLPALITQPFIENAIWHGLLPLNNLRDPKLKISFLQQQEIIIIEIEDNGVGRSFSKKNNHESKGTKLVMDKIETLNRLSSHSKHTIEIIDLFDKDEQPMGTKVKIQMNKITE